MTEGNSTNIPQPCRPFVGGGDKYDALRVAAVSAIAVPLIQDDVFSMHITATRKGGDSMDEEQKFLIDMIFKPNEKSLKLRPAETQLLLSYFSEILKEVEADEITAAQEQEPSSCR